MKVCFVGLGSIGCRHLRNLSCILKSRGIELIVHAFRESNKRLDDEIKELVDSTILRLSDLDDDYDIVFITNPTYKHYDSLKKFLWKTKNIFIEKPIFDDSKCNWRELFQVKDINAGIYYVAAPLRYTKVIEQIKRIIKNNEVYSVRSICSSYLPDWRPNVDYRDVYSAHKEQGGGVSIDCIHELDYLFYLFGFPEHSINLRGKYSNLEIDSEDISVYMFKYKDKIAELHLDYFGKNKERNIEVYTKEGLFVGDFYRNQIIYPNGEIEKFNSDTNDMYINELSAFLDMIKGKALNENSIEHSVEVLRFAEGDI
ncbi:Gfo/Idh/MocA family oxidoreductase [Clostridium sp.]|uniref:Gfo/Idh/MocA family protein n=1 Tax=Clostridium sp. TaxID=1506 RepID=UPI001A539B1F|nr:Gfo/Idh/MocA family oxidoreductase [Clostridium sp.]MBK5240795.1 Gfo/Idh/MocA family oxidoreductase [Clostridium sp.]